MRVLIANRGEIARRIIRTARAQGHTTVAVFAEPDALAPHVADADHAVGIGPADLAASYLDPERILAAAADTNADAIHPGYGFLSENADFARAVTDAGLVWIGPTPSAIDAMGSKIEARRLAAEARVPVIPGFDTSQDPADLAAAADRIGYPVLVKASAGGGGKGIRIAEHANEFAAALEEASTEAERNFGDGRVLVERFITRPRHIEVQILGDKHGAVIDLGTRECSVQRRYQKVLEEAPAPNLSAATEQGLRQAAVRLAASIGYDNAGTVEFVVDDETGDFFFLEMNTRLQVEHPVTEAVTGLDLVALQLQVGAGEPLPLTADDIRFDGHAFEARINAEDTTDDFSPQLGTVTHLRIPPSVRWDSGIEIGSSITPFYDSMVAKLIVHGHDRANALSRLRDALDEVLIGGVTVNTGLHRWLVDTEAVRQGHVTTRFLDEAELPPDFSATTAAALAARAWNDAAVTGSAAWAATGARRFTPHASSPGRVLEDLTGTLHEVEPADVGAAVAAVEIADRRVVVNHLGQSHTFRVVSRSEHWAPTTDGSHGSANAVVAPFPAVVAEVSVEPGDSVDGTDPVVVIEAMKMLHTLTAGGAGMVAEVRVAPGDQVETNQVLVTFQPAEET